MSAAIGLKVFRTPNSLILGFKVAFAPALHLQFGHLFSFIELYWELYNSHKV